MNKRVLLVPLVLLLLATACKPTTPALPPPPPGSTTSNGTLTLRLGYIPSLTQATAVIGVHNGVFTNTLGTTTAFQPTTYTSAKEEAAALTSGALDAAYLDPNTAIAAFQSSKGALRIVAGATRGGAYLMTKYYAIKDGSQLRGTKLADAEAGTSNDVSLRWWLKSVGLTPGSNVTVVNEAWPAIVQQYKAGQITGAWVPEQWASVMQIDAGATQFQDEAALWPSTGYPAAVLVMRADYLQAHPDTVTNFLIGHLTATDLVAANSVTTENEAAAAIKALTGQTVSVTDSELAWSHLRFTSDPIAPSIMADASHAQALGLIGSASISGIFDLGPVNAILQAAQRPLVSGA